MSIHGECWIIFLSVVIMFMIMFIFSYFVMCKLARYNLRVIEVHEYLGMPSDFLFFFNFLLILFFIYIYNALVVE